MKMIAVPELAPVSEPDRIATLDILRGAALFGILVVNWTVNSRWDTDAWSGFSGAADQIAWWTFTIFFDEKTRVMFTFLFGLGFAIQMMRAEQRGVPFVATYARRLAILFVIGAVHFILTERDILWVYAIFGFLLLPLRNLNPKLLLALALVWLLIPFALNRINPRSDFPRSTETMNAGSEIALDPAVLDAYVGEYELESQPYGVLVTREDDTLFAQIPGFPGRGDFPLRLGAESPTEFFVQRGIAKVSFVKDSAGTVTGMVWHHDGKDVYGRIVQRGTESINDAARRRVAGYDPVYRTYATGSFAEIFSLRIGLFWKDISSFTTDYRRWLHADFAIFLLGLYAGRRRIFHDIGAHRPFIRKVMWLGLAFGLAAVAFAFRELVPGVASSDQLASFVPRGRAGIGGNLGSAALGLAYIAALTLLLERNGWQQTLRPLAAVGRMALTNYLMQSVAFMLLFFGYGLGWFGQTGAFYGLILASALFALQIVASRWWLRRLRFGPVEWLWRTLTYGRLQPM